MIKRICDIVLLQVSGTDSNIYIIGDHAVDSGTGLNFTRMYQLLKAAQIDPKSIKVVVNTHTHYDHVGGNGYFLNAKTAMHEADAPALENADAEMCMVDYFDGKLKPRSVDAKLKDGDRLSIGGYNFQVLHTPGHTPGSICLYDASKKILISGDIIFADGIGRIDVPGGDPDAMQVSLDALAKLKVDKILPGHGEPVQSGGGAVIAKLAKAGVSVPDEDSEEEDVDDIVPV
ncbi:MAG: MBL fold metallo-hydrolase [Candidatus Aenigmarchaeota archaeon]|nr:MBL fold metallo-hydrolase [Candidatus Aenigmarchaeota archaeon]